MRLNGYVAEKRMAIFDDLKNGLPPREGTYDEAALADAKVKGQPQMGTTRYEPNAIFVEYIYPDPGSSAAVVTVRLDPPERIVFLPVPEWVVESIWQGEIFGSYEFESDAIQLLENLQRSLSPEANRVLFDQPKMATGRS